MRNSLLKAVVGVGLLTLAAAMGAAQAGGFTRGTADTDLLFEDGNFNMRVDARVVVPTQKFSTNANPALVGTNFYGTYIIPSAAVKFDLNHNLRCESTWTQNVGADTDICQPEIRDRQALRKTSTPTSSAPPALFALMSAGASSR